VTKSSSVRTWLAGKLLRVAAERAGTRSSTTAALTLEIAGDSTVSLEVFGGGGGVGGGASALDDLSDVVITAAASGDILRHNGTNWVDAVGTTHFDAAGTAASAVAAHEADTTNVHGIADTSALLTTTAHDARDHTTAMSTVVLDDISDVSIAAAASGDVLRWNGSAWVDFADSAYATASSVSDHLADTSDAHDASAISFVAGGTIAGTDVQTAVAEVATDAATALSTHEADSTSVHGIANTALLLTGIRVEDEGSSVVAGATALNFVGSAVTVTDAGSNEATVTITGGGVATDTLWDTKGDIAAATGADAAAKLAVGSVAYALTPDSTASTGLSWSYVPSIRERTLSHASTVIAESVPYMLVGSNNSSVLTSGRLHLVAIPLSKGDVVTSISFQSATTAANGPTNQWFGLFDQDRAALKLTADDTTTAWASNTTKTLNLTSTHTCTYTGLHYAGIMVAASVAVPTLRGFTVIGSGSGLTAIRVSRNCDTGLTTPPGLPFTASVGVSLTPGAYCWVE